MRSSTAVLIKGFTIIPLSSGIEAGIYIWGGCDDCTIANNVLANFSEKISYSSNQYGVRLDGSNCEVANNTFVNDGLAVMSYSNQIVSNNTVNGKPLVYLYSVVDCTIEDAGQVILVNCNNMLVKNNDLSYATIGVELLGTTNSYIIGNNLANSTAGILTYSSYGYIAENNITGNLYGIEMVGGSVNELIKNNVSDNYIGIYLASSSINNISKNDLGGNKYGIYAYLGSSINITGNKIIDNEYGGAYLHSCSGLNIAENELRNNAFGIYWYASSGNKVYHNDFIDSTYVHVYSPDAIQTWDDGYPSGGNYWSGYIDEDTKKGPGQNIDGSDGIWDNPYNIDNNDTDTYPFVNPWGSAEEADFELTVTPSYRIIYQGQSTDYTVNITSIGGFNSSVDLSLSGLPANASYVFTPEQVTPPIGGTGQSTLQISTEPSVVTGIYQLNITGASNETTRSVEVNLAIAESIPPLIDLISPENETYSTNVVPLTFTVDEPTSWIGYSLDGQANVTITGNTTLPGLSNGIHHVRVHATDLFGNIGSSDTVYFTVLVIVHDVTVLSISSSSNEVCEGEAVNITVVVRNNGDVAETFNVTVFANDTTIQVKSVQDLAPATQSNLTFTWNTTGCALGSYTIKAEASIVPGETHVTDNVKIWSPVIMIPELTSLLFIPLLFAAILALMLRKRTKTR